jgi:hypothetical protein
MSWKHIFCPEPSRELPGERGIRIALRTAHIAAAGILLGGHFFTVDATRLLPWLWLAIGTGAVFVALELYGSCVWLVQGRGLLTLLKLLLVALVPVFWTQRIWLLLAAVVIGSVGSHMSSRWRYHSVLHHRLFDHKKRG